MSARVEKVQKLTRKVLGEEIQNLKDPRVGFTTVTAVRITPDLRHARVFVSVLGSLEEQEETMKGLRSATPHLRTEVGRQIRMRYLPDIVFELDTQTSEAQRIETLLKKIHDESSGQ